MLSCVQMEQRLQLDLCSQYSLNTENTHLANNLSKTHVCIHVGIFANQIKIFIQIFPGMMETLKQMS